MKNFFIKGRRVKPGVTITNGWYTWVITNEYKLRRVSSGSHAEIHVTKEEMRAVRQYFVVKPLIDVVDAFARACKRLSGKE